MHRFARAVTLFATAASLPLAAARADEGMWTFDAFPAAKMRAAYGWAPDQAWLDRVRLAKVRLTGGCSASFVSGSGLILTNQHCVASCLERSVDSRQRPSRQRLHRAHPRRGKEMPRPAGRSRHRDQRRHAAGESGDRQRDRRGRGQGAHRGDRRDRKGRLPRHRARPAARSSASTAAASTSSTPIANIPTCGSCGRPRRGRDLRRRSRQLSISRATALDGSLPARL